MLARSLDISGRGTPFKCTPLSIGVMRYSQTFVQASKFELVFNVQTARMIGFIVPTSVLNCADEVFD
jgi:hypothetical protein